MKRRQHIAMLASYAKRPVLKALDLHVPIRVSGELKTITFLDKDAEIAFENNRMKRELEESGRLGKVVDFTKYAGGYMGKVEHW